MRKINRRSTSISIALALGVALCARADTGVILGAGNIGSWTTAGYVANPNGSTEFVTIANVPFPCSPPMACPLNPVMVPALGSASLTSFLTGPFDTFYVTQQESSPSAFPIVRASLESTIASRSVDIPVVTLSRLMAASISALNFGGITSEPPPPCAIGIPCFRPHSSLVLGNIQRSDTAPTEDLPVLLELFDPDGNRVGSASLTVAYGKTILIGDVVAYVGALGATPLGGLGQLRVTRVSGGALMWGIVYTISFGGSVTASAGVNLSP